MAEPNGTVTPAAPAPGATPAGAPAPEFKVPDGHRLVRDDDWAKAQRHEQAVKGYEPFYKNVKDLGFEKPDDLAQYKDFFTGVKKRGWDPQMLKRLVADEPEAPVQHQQTSDFDPKKFREEIRSEMKTEAALERHGSVMTGESALIDSAAKEFAGDKASDYDLKMIRGRLRADLEELRELYPENHLLREKVLQPFSKELVAKAVAALKTEKADFEAKRLTIKADKLVKQPVTGSVAGNTGGQGKVETKDNHDHTRPGMPSTRGDIEAAFEARRNARGRFT